MKPDDHTKALRSLAIGGAFDAFDVPHSSRDRIHRKLMAAPFPGGSEITDDHTKKKLIRHAACVLAAENAFAFTEYADLRERGLLG